MLHITVTEARKNIFQLIQNVHESHEPILLTGKHNNVVVISEEDWRSIQETIYLSSIPGMVESIKEAKNTPLNDCDDTPLW